MAWVGRLRPAARESKRTRGTSSQSSSSQSLFSSKSLPPPRLFVPQHLAQSDADPVRLRFEPRRGGVVVHGSSDGRDVGGVSQHETVEIRGNDPRRSDARQRRPRIRAPLPALVFPGATSFSPAVASQRPPSDRRLGGGGDVAIDSPLRVDRFAVCANLDVLPPILRPRLVRVRPVPVHRVRRGRSRLPDRTVTVRLGPVRCSHSRASVRRSRRRARRRAPSRRSWCRSCAAAGAAAGAADAAHGRPGRQHGRLAPVEVIHRAVGHEPVRVHEAQHVLAQPRGCGAHPAREQPERGSSTSPSSTSRGSARPGRWRRGGAVAAWIAIRGGPSRGDRSTVTREGGPESAWTRRAKSEASDPPDHSRTRVRRDPSPGSVALASSTSILPPSTGRAGPASKYLATKARTSSSVRSRSSSLQSRGYRSTPGGRRRRRGA